jgi:hypothetical protein
VLNIAFLADGLDDETSQKLIALRTDIDDFHIHGREVYWLCRKKQSGSKISNAVLEKALCRKATLRGANTVLSSKTWVISAACARRLIRALGCWLSVCILRIEVGVSRRVCRTGIWEACNYSGAPLGTSFAVPYVGMSISVE